MHPEAGTANAPFYVWQPEAKPVAVQVQFDVVDRILLEVMRGFGAVPKRGAEVGGILLGTIDTDGDQITVKVEDFESVESEHASGPSYILSEHDRAAFREAIERWTPGPDRRIYAVGYYRGHTRDGLCLAAEDLSLMEELFPGPNSIALIVKPYATKVSMAGIFFREDGQFKADASHLEFPFRRKELGGGSSGLERMAAAARFGQRTGEDPRIKYGLDQPDGVPAGGGNSMSLLGLGGGAPETVEPSGTRVRGVRAGWVWIPLSFIFMLLGVVVGFQIALTLRPKQPANPWLEAWDLTLQVKKSGEQLDVTWDPLAPAVRNSNRGALIIQSRDETRTIDLRGAQLHGGSVVYKGVPDRVIFRLEVYPREHVVVSESSEFQREP